MDVDTFEDLDFAILSHIPLTLHQVVERVVANNQDIKLAIVDINNAEEDASALKSRSFFPKIEGILEQKFKHNVSGSPGAKEEFLGKLELTIPISLGGTEYHEYKASLKDKDSLTIAMELLREETVEEVQNAWQKLITSTLIWTSLRRQADLAAASLELAYKEKAFGIRSQIDVLSTETGLLTAQSDAASARIDILIDALSLLAIMGDVNIGILSKRKVEKGAVPRASLPFFHRDLSTEPSKRVLEGLRKIAESAMAKVAAPDKSAPQPMEEPEPMLSDEERRLEEEYLQESPDEGETPGYDGVDAGDQAPQYDVEPESVLSGEEAEEKHLTPMYDVNPEEIMPEGGGRFDDVDPAAVIPGSAAAGGPHVHAGVMMQSEAQTSGGDCGPGPCYPEPGEAAIGHE